MDKELIPYAHISKGTLLLATPEMDAGMFARGVILVCEHSAEGSFGLMINKPLEIPIPEDILPPEEIHNAHITVHAGGPVQTNQMMLLHTSGNIPNQTMKVCEGVYLGGDLQFLHETAKDEQGPLMKLCFGYAGWNGGQLEREFLDGNWYLFPATCHHIFKIPPKDLWKALLREMGGKYAVLSMIPEDLSLN